MFILSLRCNANWHTNVRRPSRCQSGADSDLTSASTANTPLLVARCNGWLHRLMASSNPHSRKKFRACKRGVHKRLTRCTPFLPSCSRSRRTCGSPAPPNDEQLTRSPITPRQGPTSFTPRSKASRGRHTTTTPVGGQTTASIPGASTARFRCRDRTRASTHKSPRPTNPFQARQRHYRSSTWRNQRASAAGSRAATMA